MINYHQSLLIIVRHCQGEADVGGGDHRVGEGMVRWVLDIFRDLFRNQNNFTFLHLFKSLSTRVTSSVAAGPLTVVLPPEYRDHF